MNYNESTIGGMFSGKTSFVIPVYQRAYSWERPNWEAFLGDIKEQSVLGNEYTYGNILLEEIQKDRQYEIIDGQQRLSTLIIFMRAMINVLKEKGYSESELDELTVDFMQRGGVKKLRPVDYDQSFFDTVILENNEKIPASSSQKLYKDALDYFTDELKSMTLDQLESIKEMVLNTRIYRLELKGKSEAALMFELQNNRGKDLTNLEKLKSYFLYQIYINSPKEETEANIETVSNYFKEIYRIHHDIKNVKEDSILIYHCNAYLNMAYAYRTLDDIKKEYNEAIDKVAWIKDFVYQLSLSFQSIKEIQNGNFKYFNKLKRVAGKDSVPAFAFPFIIKGYKLLKNDREKIEKLLHLLEIVAFRYYLISSRAEINSRLSDIIRSFDGDLEKLRTTLKNKLNDTWYWRDEKVKELINGYMYRNPVLHYLLWEYEESLQKKGYFIGTLQIPDEEIEHISPQTPPEGEKIAIGYEVEADGNYSKEFIEKHLNSIGNLMLISKSHNASIGNNPFVDKLSTYRENPMLKQHAQIPELTGDRMEWTSEQIVQRKEMISEFAASHWSFDNV